MAVIEINGQSFEVDMTTAKRIDEFHIGQNVKILKKDYNGYKSFPGVITEFINFKNLPTIVIAIFVENYLDTTIEFIYLNSETNDIEIAPTCEHELQINKERAVDKFNIQIEKLQGQIDDLKAKRDYFIRYFDKHFSGEI